MKFLVPNYSCFQNPWLGGTAPRSPFSLSSTEFVEPPPSQPNKIPGYSTSSDSLLKVMGEKGQLDSFLIRCIFQCRQPHLWDKLKLSSVCFISVVLSFVFHIPEIHCVVTWESCPRTWQYSGPWKSASDGNTDVAWRFCVKEVFENYTWKRNNYPAPLWRRFLLSQSTQV